MPSGVAWQAVALCEGLEESHAIFDYDHEDEYEHD
jgi:hypothetical protein